MQCVRSPDGLNKEKNIVVGYAKVEKEKEIKIMDKMRFEEFKNEVVGKIREFLPESFASADVSLQMVRKNNDLQLTGLTIRSAESNISPTIYLEKFFEEYQDGADMREILSKIAQVRMNHEVSEQFDVAQITDFEQVKGKLVPRLVNADMNAALLEGRPHKLVADLAVTYCVILDQSFDGTASVAVTNDLMNSWAVTLDELHEVAISNLTDVLTSTFKGMTEVMSEMMGMSKEDMEMMDMSTDEEQMYVLSNTMKMNGASALLDKKIMEEIVETFGEFYILPSSIHEVLIVPVKSGMDIETLENMVCEVNDTQVQLEERLSDHVYAYSLEDGIYLAK